MELINAKWREKLRLALFLSMDLDQYEKGLRNERNRMNEEEQGRTGDARNGEGKSISFDEIFIMEKEDYETFSNGMRVVRGILTLRKRFGGYVTISNVT
jgi:hypothetical protein